MPKRPGPVKLLSIGKYSHGPGLYIHTIMIQSSY